MTFSACQYPARFFWRHHNINLDMIRRTKNNIFFYQYSVWIIKKHFRFIQSNSWQQCQRVCQIFIMDGMFRFRGTNKRFIKVTFMYAIVTQYWGPTRVLTQCSLVTPYGDIDRSSSSLSQVLACFLTAPIHYMKRCWISIKRKQCVTFSNP